MLTRAQFIAKLFFNVKAAYEIVEAQIVPPISQHFKLQELAFDAVLHRLIWMKTTDFKDEDDDD